MDHTENSLTAAIKSLNDAVAPAVDPNDPLASQQLTLVVEFLSFLRSRLPHLHTRARMELETAVQLGQSVKTDVGKVSLEYQQRLSDQIARGTAVIEDPSANTEELENVTAGLLAVMRCVIRNASGVPSDLRKRLAKVVIDSNEENEEFYRSWYEPFGFDSYPETIRSFNDVIAQKS